MLEFERVSFFYKKNTPVLRDLSFRLEDGGFLTVMGESGCGKSTLLSLAAGLLTPTDGR
ncbi:MAG TPA: ABC transporter ATP-binding protein, partial [Clostridiales bacterium]|nr:ABC transporter ATP-binding protein [Clostridiales bacterium]